MSSTTQDQFKRAVGHAALDYLVPGEVIGVGTGSTVNCFIDALAESDIRVPGAISSSERSTERLRAIGIRVFDCNEVDQIPVYIDGADEIDPRGCMIKGGGAALTREKIVAAQAERFVCIADQSKRVDVLGKFPLPIEVIPMAVRRLIRQFSSMGDARLRMDNGQPLRTDNGLQLLDVHGLNITDPETMEDRISQWPGVVTCGIFAHQRARVCLLGTDDGVQVLHFDE